MDNPVSHQAINGLLSAIDPTAEDQEEKFLRIRLTHNGG
jgi:hypothetical protein